MSCPDCKDGFYYPLVGPPETCRSCGGISGDIILEVKRSSANFQLQSSYAAMSSGQFLKYLEEQDATRTRRTRDYMKNDFFAEAYGGKAKDAPKTLSDAGDESSPLREIGHHRQRATEMIAAHPASVHPDPQDAKGHFLEPIFGDRTIDVAKAQDSLNKQIKILESPCLKPQVDLNYKKFLAGFKSNGAKASTDLSKWYQDASKPRKESLTKFFNENPVNVFSGLAIETPINRAILGRFFKVTQVQNIEKFFLSFNREIYLGDFASFINEQDERCGQLNKAVMSSTGLSRQTLKENGFDPREL